MAATCQREIKRENCPRLSFLVVLSQENCGEGTRFTVDCNQTDVYKNLFLWEEVPGAGWMPITSPAVGGGQRLKCSPNLPSLWLSSSSWRVSFEARFCWEKGQGDLKKAGQQGHFITIWEIPKALASHVGSFHPRFISSIHCGEWTHPKVSHKQIESTILIWS